MNIAIDIDAEDLGMVRVALLDAIAEAEGRRKALEHHADCADVVAGISHRIHVLTSVKNQVGDYEVAQCMREVLEAR